MSPRRRDRNSVQSLGTGRGLVQVDRVGCLGCVSAPQTHKHVHTYTPYMQQKEKENDNGKEEEKREEQKEKKRRCNVIPELAAL